MSHCVVETSPYYPKFKNISGMPMSCASDQILTNLALRLLLFIALLLARHKAAILGSGKISTAAKCFSARLKLFEESDGVLQLYLASPTPSKAINLGFLKQKQTRGSHLLSNCEFDQVNQVPCRCIVGSLKIQSRQDHAWSIGHTQRGVYSGHGWAFWAGTPQETSEVGMISLDLLPLKKRSPVFQKGIPRLAHSWS